MENTPKCSDCRFYMKAAEDLSGRSGICHRNPPTPVVLAGPKGQPIPSSLSPPVREDHWCGQFEGEIPKILQN